jgi:hypothetical protein
MDMEATIVRKWLTSVVVWPCIPAALQPGLGGLGPTTGGQPCKQEFDPG